MELINDFFELSLKGKLFVGVVILLISIIQAVLFRLKIYYTIIGIIIVQIALFILLSILGSYTYEVHLFYFLPSIVLSLFIYIIIPQRGRNLKENNDPWKVILPTVKGAPILLDNIKRGVAIFGSAGAGKTESVFVPIIKNAVKCNVTGINYDYKDGEITEIVNYFYKDSNIETYNIIPHRPELSHRVNPIDPSYIDSPEMVNELVRILFKNMREKGSNDKGFFRDVPESVLAGTIWRLKTDYPKYCTIPHAIAICIVKSPKELADFLKKNNQSRITASPFFDSLEAKDQMAGVKATLSNDLRKFAFPSIFYVLSKNEVDLHVNNPLTPGMLNLVNSPDKELTLSPFLALIFTTTIKLMQQRDMLPSYLLMDEAATLNLPSFSRIPATMRSYNIATIYSLQDKVLGTEQYGDITTRAILSNLSYQIIGKTNDPESVRYYKQIVQEIEKKQISKSYGTSFMPKGETRQTESMRETSKYKNQDFFSLNTGEFLVLSDGNDRKVKFGLVPFERVSLKVRNHLTNKDLEDNYNKILNEAVEIE